MKRRGWVWPILLVILTGAPAEEPAAELPDVVVLDVVGEVDFQRAPKQEWVVAERGMQFGQGARLCTGVDAEALLACGSTCLVYVGQVTLFEVRSIQRQDSELSLGFHVDPGIARLLVRNTPDQTTRAQITRPLLTCSVGRGRHPVNEDGGWIVEGSGDDPARIPSRRALTPPPPPPTTTILPIVLDCTEAEDDASREFARNAFRSLIDGWSANTEEASGAACWRAAILMDQVILLEAGYPSLAAHLGAIQGDEGETAPGYARIEWGVLSCSEQAAEVRAALDRLLKASPHAASLRGD